MNWSRTKSIFIVAFLILDLFLIYQLHEKNKNAGQYINMNQTTPKERLAENDIQYSGLPQIKSAVYIKGESVLFSTIGANHETIKAQAETKEVVNLNLEKKDNQSITFSPNQTTIISTFKQPVDIPDDFSVFLEDYIYKGTQYEYWKTDNVTGAMVFIETFDGHPVFSRSEDQTGTLKLFVKDDQIVSYEQTYVTFEKYTEKKTILPAIPALDSLLGNDGIPIGSTVGVKLSYLSLVEEDLDAGNVYVPTWYITVQEDKDAEKQDYFVNAVSLTVHKLEKETE